MSSYSRKAGANDDYRDEWNDAERYQLSITPYYIIAYREEIPNGYITLCAFCFLFVAQFAYFRMFVIYYSALSYTK